MLRTLALRVPFLAAVLLIAGSAAAQDGPTDGVPDDPQTVVPERAELVIGLDARTLYGDATFDAIMDLVEASEGYRSHTSQLEAWGFDPRADVHEVVFAIDRFGAPDAEFVVVATGDLSATNVTSRLDEQAGLARVDSDAGPVWRDVRGTTYAITERVAIAGQGTMFTHAQDAIAAGARRATSTAESTVWLRARPSAALRERLDVLGTMQLLEAFLEVDSTPAIRVRVSFDDENEAIRAVAELERIVRAVADIPEVSALRIDGLLRNAVVVAEGTTVRMDAEIDASTWNVFSDMLSDLIAEELR